jgi:glycosyltransferase involved in cell wall biosynthesis
VTPARTRPRPATGHEAAIASAPYHRHRRIHRSRGHTRPRLLQLLATGGSGGAQESYTGLLLHLDRNKYEVRALSLSRGSAVQRVRRLGITVDVIDQTDDAAATRQLVDYLRHHEIDLVHAHMFRAEVIGTRAALAAGTPVIMATVHSSRVRSAEDRELLARLTPQMDRLIVPSASIEAKVRAEGRTGAQFSVIPNGIDLDRFSLPAGPCSLRRELGIPRDALLIGVVARLEPEKGHRYLVEAMPAILDQAPDAWLAIVGSGSVEAELRDQVSRLPASVRSRITLTGLRDDISALTAELDIAVLPSLREAQGISILEAMARRRPVVASAVGGVPEVLTDGVDGLLVPPRLPAALADAIGRLAADASLRRRLADAGRATVAARFSIDAMVRQVENVYDEELLRSGATARLSPGSIARSRRVPRERAALEVPPV